MRRGNQRLISISLSVPWLKNFVSLPRHISNPKSLMISVFSSSSCRYPIWWLSIDPSHRSSFHYFEKSLHISHSLKFSCLPCPLITNGRGFSSLFTPNTMLQIARLIFSPLLFSTLPLPLPTQNSSPCTKPMIVFLFLTPIWDRLEARPCGGYSSSPELSWKFCETQTGRLLGAWYRNQLKPRINHQTKPTKKPTIQTGRINRAKSLTPFGAWYAGRLRANGGGFRVSGVGCHTMHSGVRLRKFWRRGCEASKRHPPFKFHYLPHKTGIHTPHIRASNHFSKITPQQR